MNTRRDALRLQLQWLGLWTLLLTAPAVSAADPSRPIAVVYPEIGEPFRSVFAKIIEGIEEQSRGRVQSFAVGSNANVQELSSELRRQDIRVVIALGRNGLKAASSLDRDIGVVAGGVLSVPESDTRSFAVHSLAPDPALLFGQLKMLMPGVRRVLVVHDPRQNGWLIRRAREAARQHGIELVAQEADDLKAAIRFYQDSFATADAKRDVLWLPQDSTTVDETAVLPLVLQESWNRNLLVFSSSVAHVKRGALFALYPNNVELGRSLAHSALGVVSGASAARGVQTLKEVLVAVNVRTASHLGIQLSGRQHFDLIFPEP
ncbi:MAG TPA: ABC transporter substrate binding protein [Albitalea sp.]|jgi:putative ABC transport system substrate-binding protein|nr:ABC transporter substrate binding protein [Albitalea sp.]